ncbi:MazG-like family protein [uncultured Flavobacterium sp.]|uniref:MazG-like family protein n=1 Tax=uncultured Flavobacterium sp. TaxID=165435 RepID=UPI00259854B4|nr:MazG-like family protein [uncultured Flavobacterium sp.]
MTNNLPTNWQELQAAIEQWGTDRNFYGEGGATYTGQWMKLVEEFGELVLGLNKNKPELIKDALGDMVVVLVHMVRLSPNRPNLLLPESNIILFASLPIAVSRLLILAYDLLGDFNCKGSTLRAILETLADIAKQKLELPLFDCVLASYIEIKDRKGQMIDGKFIKNEDLN